MRRRDGLERQSGKWDGRGRTSCKWDGLGRTSYKTHPIRPTLQGLRLRERRESGNRGRRSAGGEEWDFGIGVGLVDNLEMDFARAVQLFRQVNQREGLLLLLGRV